jgi:hypothetical protein
MPVTMPSTRPMPASLIVVPMSRASVPSLKPSQMSSPIRLGLLT